MSDTSRSGGEGAVGEGPVADARGLADMSSDVLIVVAPDLTVRRASSAAAGVLGRDPAEMAGASAPVLVREEDRELLETLLRRGPGGRGG